MSDQQRGYRGALPPRRDRLAPIWVSTVIGIFVLIFVLAFLGLPTGLFADETPSPAPSVSATSSPDASLAPGSISPTGSP